MCACMLTLCGVGQVAVAAARALLAQVDPGKGLLLQDVVFPTPLLVAKPHLPATELAVQVQQQNASVATKASSAG